MAGNRQRGFRYERLAAKRLQPLLERYSKEKERWWAYRIPLSSGIMVIHKGNRLWLPGDVIVGCSGYGVQTVEVKSTSKQSNINRILKHVKCNFLMIHQHRRWLYWYRSVVASDRYPNRWHLISEKEFILRLMACVRQSQNRDDIVLVPGSRSQLLNGI